MSHRHSAADAPVDHLRLIVGAGEPAAAHAALATDEFDALADLFLDETPHRNGSSSATRAPHAAQDEDESTARVTMRLELVVAANVPRPPGVWFVAYARSRAATLRASVLLVRSDNGLAEAQVVAPLSHGADNEGSDEVRAQDAAHTILVATRSIPDEIVARVSRITILSGSGETGVISAYSAVKRVLTEGVADRTGRATIGVCFVGTSRERALAAHRALYRACESFLSVHVEFAGALERADHAACHTVWRSQDATLTEALRASENATRTPRRALAPHSHRPSNPRVETPSPAPAPTRAARCQTNKPAPAPEASDAALPARCPEAPEVRFRVDHEGGLHLHIEDVASSAADAAAALLAASAWAERHHETLDALALAAGFPALRTDKPICHLTTRDARRVRPYLDTSLRLDVVAMPARPGEPVRVALN